MKHMLAIILFCLAGIAGIPSWQVPKQSVGYFTVSTNPYGVAVYQEGKHASIQFDNARSFQISGNTITISLSPTTETLATFSRDDIVFDGAGRLYTEPTQEQIDMITKLAGIALEKVEASDRRVPFDAQTLYLVNPHIPGMLEMRITSPDLWIDRDQKRIGTNGHLPESVVVRVHDGVSL